VSLSFPIVIDVNGEYQTERFAQPLESSSKLERILECVFFAINRLVFLAIANAIARKNNSVSI
jgi:hypothetical protein